MASDVWFHRYKDGVDIEGRCECKVEGQSKTRVLTYAVDYNSWVESDKGLQLGASLPKDAVIVEGRFTSSIQESGADSILQATRSMSPTEIIWPRWVTGETIKMRSLSSME